MVNRKPWQCWHQIREEHPVAFQLFGSDPEIMGKASAIVAQFHPDCIDINMGCPVPKVTKRGAGAALMRNPSLPAGLSNVSGMKAYYPSRLKSAQE